MRMSDLWNIKNPQRRLCRYYSRLLYTQLHAGHIHQHIRTTIYDHQTHTFIYTQKPQSTFFKLLW